MRKCQGQVAIAFKGDIPREKAEGGRSRNSHVESSFSQIKILPPGIGREVAQRGTEDRDRCTVTPGGEANQRPPWRIEEWGMI